MSPMHDVRDDRTALVSVDRRTPTTPVRAAPSRWEEVLAVTAPVERHLADVLTAERDRWRPVDPALGDVIDRVADFVLVGGKRLRPALVHWGYVAGGGDRRTAQTAFGAGSDTEDPPAVVRVAAAMELLHAFALLHDDVMDGAATRRGRASFHERERDRHRSGGWRGEDRRFGEGLAVLAGDLAYVYADRLLGADLPADVRLVWDELRIEVTLGQHLDVLGAATGDRDPARAALVAQYKSGRYSVERPLHLGAALAGRLADLAGPFTRFGRPLGTAFQYRDDLLGAVGDPDETGKPVGDDLREGKPTYVLALAHERATPAGRRLLEQVGRADLTDADVARLQQVLRDSGAVDAVERTIGSLVEDALGSLHRAPITDLGREALDLLARHLAFRGR